MKKIFIFLNIFFLIIILAACGNNISEYASISGTTEVVKSGYSIPLKNAIVSIDNNQTKTSENGSFNISGLQKGEAVVNVYIDSYEQEVNSTQSYISPQQVEDSQILVWSNKINLDSGDNLIDISVSPLGEVLRYAQSGWQLAFYANPPLGKNIVKGTITAPNGVKYDMEPHFEPQWHKWLPVDKPLPGPFKYEIELDDGSQQIFTVYISEDDFDISFPDLNYPINYIELNTTTPTFQYYFSSEAAKAYLRIEEKISANEWEPKDWIPVDNNLEHTIESGILEKGKNYRWTIQPVFKSKVFPWTEAKAPYEYFSIAP